MPSPADSAFERHHDSWPAFHQYLDGYCSRHGVNIGVEFTVSAAGRNRDVRRSKRAAQGEETVQLLLPSGKPTDEPMYADLGANLAARIQVSLAIRAPFGLR